MTEMNENLDRVGTETDIDDTPVVDDADEVVDAEMEAARNAEEVHVDTTAKVQTDADTTGMVRNTDFDIFAWANSVSRIKNDLNVELFLINKRYTVYHLQIANELKPQVAPVFILETLTEIEKGAGLGLEIREFEKSESEPGVLLYSARKQVSNANHILNVIENERSSVETFNEYDHEFKTIKMIVARFTHKDIEPFYICKQVASSSSLNERTAWEINEDGKLQQFNAASAFKVPTDNQVLICGGGENEFGEKNQQIFAFAPKKFEAMFGYNYKKQAIADKKVDQILSRYNLNFPEGQDLNTMVAGHSKLINKLQNLELGTKTQEELVDYGESMGLDLMTTDDGAIIIMDTKDIDTFVSLLNDDYMTSDLTGLRYEIKSKKLLEVKDE
ncbi:MAG: DUF4868 domain-containing protein [Candidatus Saccharibacteria bacterium]|nr:DUF4868 domain-containing protein [Candidatus Saccharibacteria bacterium]